MDYNKSLQEKKEREEWISSLQVGDKVALEGYGLGRNRYWYITKVVKITPSGRKNLENGLIIMPDGSIRGDNGNYAHPITEEIKVRIWRRKAIIKLNKEMRFDELSDNNLNRLLTILKESQENQN
ncbi:hypothetical protein [Peribacillus asahii]|uniref:hypothetical protein n=1 Tax=Peribacillus asahii TaxID=228899 RepID=UPI003810DD4A